MSDNPLNPMTNGKMKEHQMYPHNPSSAESILNEKLKDVSHGWVDNQRALVLEAMEQYAQQELQAYRDKLKAAISKRMGEVDPAFALAYYDITQLIDAVK